MKRQFVLLTLVSLLLLPIPATTFAYDWEYVGMSGVGATCIEADWHHDRLLVGTHEGFWIFDQVTEQWSEFDDEGWIGRQVHAIQFDENDADRIITGRENAFFKGYLELTEDGGLTGDVVHMSEGGAFVDFARYWGNDFIACGISDITPGELLRSESGAVWTPLAGHGHTAMTATSWGTSGELYVAGDDQVWLSWDSGDTWEDIGDGLGNELIRCFEAYHPGGDVIVTACLAGGDFGLWRSYDPGYQWEQILAGESCRRIALMWGPLPWPIGRYIVPAVVTADGRVLTGEDSGNWIDETGDLPSPAVDIAFPSYDRNIYVCTQDGGVYRFHPVITGVGNLPVAAAPTLEAWPNPFNPRVNLRYELPRDATGRLAVYDLAGRLVTVLREGSIVSGEHTVTWNAAGQASGVYVARLETDQGTAAARLVLVR